MNNGRIPGEKRSWSRAGGALGALSLLLGHPAATADRKLQTAESLRQKCSADREGARLGSYD